MTTRKVKCYIIVNDHIEERYIPANCIFTTDDGLKYFYDDYGQGSIHWPVIDKPSDAYKRYLIENVKWAKDRLPWAKKESPKEVTDLLAIIANNGKKRFKTDIWENRLKAEAEAWTKKRRKT